MKKTTVVQSKWKDRGKFKAYAAMPLTEGIPEWVKNGAWPAEDECYTDEVLSIHDERGVGVVELILILVVLIALVAIFKTQLTALVNTILAKISSSANAVMR